MKQTPNIEWFVHAAYSVTALVLLMLVAASLWRRHTARKQLARFDSKDSHET